MHMPSSRSKIGSMRVPDVILDCVAFIGEVGADGAYSPAGTGFFVSVPSDVHSETLWVYFVTAKHNVIAADGLPRQLLARVNTTDGGTVFANLEASRWIFDDDPGVDLALHRWGDIPSVHLTAAESHVLATYEVLTRDQIGIGDDVLVIGLFVAHPGRSRNSPILRSGMIATVPVARLQDQRSGFDYDAIMVELRSFGGLSGSPVLVRRGDTFLLLGLIRGHWDQIGPPVFPEPEGQTRNLGVAIVTPAEYIHRVIFADEEIRDRRRRDLAD